MSQNKLSSKDMESILTDNSNKIINDFLTYYTGRSPASYKSAIHSLMYELGKEEVADLSIVDYKNSIPQEIEDRITRDTYRVMFFRYLFAFDLLKDETGFSEVWTKESSIKFFNNKQNKNSKKKVQKDETVNANLILDHPVVHRS